MQDQTKPVLKYRFIPQLPTEEAWRNRPFKEYFSAEAMFAAIKQYEKKLGTFKYCSGIFRFKNGVFTEHRDGSEPQAYPNPRWWKTGARSCHRKCCTVIPEGETPDRSEPAIIQPKPLQRSWQEFKRVGGIYGAEEQYNHMSDKNKESIDRVVLLNVGWFLVEEVD